MYSPQEKILILAALFHDIGKFEQRCVAKNIGKHEILGERFLESFKDEFLKIFNNDSNSFDKCKEIVKGHHSGSTDVLVNICKNCDHLSASERVEFPDNEEPKDKWQHQFLSSIFSKINLLNEARLDPRYYKHELLTKKDYHVLIPKYESKEDAFADREHYKNKGNIFEKFTQDLKAILAIYENDNDFSSLINLILILFEKYMWCIPDFTGSPETDISLYNHLKDVAGLSHALFLNTKEDSANKNLALIIGDLPGIQNYIFNVVSKKPGKILRGRSIYVQILTRIFASIFLKNFGLTECNLIMLAGGKFYLIAPFRKDFKNSYESSVNEIEKYLVENFYYDLKFAAGYAAFDYEALKGKNKEKITFGSIIDKASYNLLQGRQQLFKKDFLGQINSFVLPSNYYDGDPNDTDKIKCAVTDKPIREGNDRKILLEDQEITVEKQVKNEFEIGSKVVKETVVIELDDNFSVIDVKPLAKYEMQEEHKKIILNPNLDELLIFSGSKMKLLKNAQFIEVANYCSWDSKKKHIMDFDTLIKKNDGAEVLALIKGDIDELGLIMSLGLVGDKNNTKSENDFTAISRTTTLSNHLKYFFSFFINGFLQDWDAANKKEEQLNENNKDQYVYTIFAGGDDLMIITTQSASLKLVQEFNKQFTDFVCENPEIHISYSLTNFKDSTPIRLVAEISESNQEEVKYKLTNPRRDSFSAEKNKAGTMIFDTVLKNERYPDLLSWVEQLRKWVEEEKNPVSKGTLYNLLVISYILKKFEEKKDYSRLIWHPIFTHYINRVLKNKNDQYKVAEIEEFFDRVLSINKEDKNALKLKEILHPLVCEVIYKTRKIKKENLYA